MQGARPAGSGTIVYSGPQVKSGGESTAARSKFPHIRPWFCSGCTLVVSATTAEHRQWRAEQSPQRYSDDIGIGRDNEVVLDAMSGASDEKSTTKNTDE